MTQEKIEEIFHKSKEIIILIREREKFTELIENNEIIGFRIGVKGDSPIKSSEFIPTDSTRSIQDLKNLVYSVFRAKINPLIDELEEIINP